jgi:stalled ribosome rescue protein Dom34
MQRLAIWMDHNEAKVFHVAAAGFDETTVSAPNHHVHRHPKDQETRTHNHPDDEHRFFHEVAGKLAGADQILLVGPSVTKLHFLRYLHKHDSRRESWASRRRTIRPIGSWSLTCARTFTATCPGGAPTPSG